jgi:hypothetical protein
LRNGIREYLEFHAAEADGLAAVPRRRRRYNDIRVYHDVYVLNPVCTPNGIRYRIRFDASRLHRVKLEIQQTIVFGSLLCLSPDDFTSVLIATVADRDPEKLKDGKLEINFEKDEEIGDLDKTRKTSNLTSDS